MSQPHKPSTPQDIFNTVAMHLIVQGHRAVYGKSGQCFYRAPNGDRCAIGVLIPDDIYSPLMEKKTIGCLIKDYPFLVPPHLRDHVPLLRNLQDVHDCWHGEDKPWLVFQLQRVAEHHGLDASVLIIA